MTEDNRHLHEVLSGAECLWDERAIREAIQRMAAQMEVLADKHPLVLVVMNGGLIFAGQLLPKLSYPLHIDYVHASRYGSETQGGELSFTREPVIPLQNRNVVILDDIYDEGTTLLALRDYCLEKGAREVVTSVLLDKEHNRKADPTYRPDFIGLRVPDRFVFGYGLDYRGHWRNAPGIYALKT
jgi:hypoxanthine phosphoribosyltransferase